jgi:hypothetical protein
MPTEGIRRIARGVKAPLQNAAPNPEPRPALTPAEYNLLVKAAQLSAIRLVKSDFFLLPEGFLSKDLTLVHECEIETSHFSSADGALLVVVNAEAFGTIGEPGTKRHRKVMSSNCQYLIAYDVIGEPSAAAVQTFARRVARFAAYPYFRAHFAELTSQAGLQLPPLPVIKEQRLIQEPPAAAEKIAPTEVAVRMKLKKFKTTK